MFGRYALPTDDVAHTASGVTASAEDPGYPAANLITDPSANPAKLTTYDGSWDVSLPGSVDIVGAALIDHNLDEGLDVTLGGQPIPIGPHWEDGWSSAPWVIFGSPISGSSVQLAINEPNSLLPQVGRLLLLTAIRQLSNDVRWGVVEGEQHHLVRNTTALGVNLDFELGGKERSFNGEFAVGNDNANLLLSLRRSARGMFLPWLLIPDENVNDAWYVQFTDDWQRTRETYDLNIIPFTVREVARGLQWP